MKLLSIETSCDDTGITIFEAKEKDKIGRNIDFKILANIVSSQKIHSEYGGVFPMMAKREHIKNLPIALNWAIKKAKIKNKKNPFDAIALTYGPGLELCLWSGIVFAKELIQKYSERSEESKEQEKSPNSKKTKTSAQQKETSTKNTKLKNSVKTNIPLIPVNHMEGHILSVFAKPKGSFNISLPKNSFPMISLLVSGGHTELVLVKDIGVYEIIGKTQDDAAGEAYDKVARMLGLPYPGGPRISKLAEEARKEIRQKKLSKDINIASLNKKSSVQFNFPRPMLKSDNLNFSFSGLKTSVLYAIRDLGKKKLDDNIKKMIALEFENAVIDTLIYKTDKAVKKYKIKKIIVAGGVAANKHLQRQMKRAFGKEKVLLPHKELTGDNALMIGVAGYFEYIRNKKKVPRIENISANGNLSLCE